MNDPVAQHIMLRLCDDRVIAPARVGRRLLTRAILLRCGRLAWRPHAAVAGGRPPA